MIIPCVNLHARQQSQISPPLGKSQIYVYQALTEFKQAKLYVSNLLRHYLE
jgi:hypothetical protein